MNAAFAALALVALCLTDPRGCFALPSDEDSAASVQLAGILQSKTELGPPGFGETPKVDSRVKVFVLKLEEPLTQEQLSLQPAKSGRGTSDLPKRFDEVQLRCADSAVGFPCEATLKKLVGHRIRVRGDADWAVYPTDFLPVILSVRSIRESSRRVQPHGK